MKLPLYQPPRPVGPWLAVVLSPLAMILVHRAVAAQALGSDTGMAMMAACMAWIVAELHGHQSALDAYATEYERLHLAWRAPATLAVLADLPDTPPATRQAVQAHLQRRQAAGAGAAGPLGGTGPLGGAGTIGSPATHAPQAPHGGQTPVQPVQPMQATQAEPHRDPGEPKPPL